MKSLIFGVMLQVSVFWLSYAHSSTCQDELGSGQTLSQQSINFWRTLDYEEQESVVRRLQSFVEKKRGLNSPEEALKIIKGILQYTLTGTFSPNKLTDLRDSLVHLASLKETSEEVSAELIKLSQEIENWPLGS